MTPKEKAISLVKSMSISDDTYLNRNRYAKQCALIAIDEMIKVTPWNGETDTQVEDGSKEFYINVKKEIEKL